MKHVTVIDADGVVKNDGLWDGHFVDGDYCKINGHLYHRAYVYPTEHAEYIGTILRGEALLVKAARDKHMKALYELGPKYRVK